MKRKILQMLKEASPEFVSGNCLCEALGISRQAVWKNISSLKDMGYEVESAAQKGYRIKKVPDILYAPEIASLLREDSFCKEIKVYSSVDSTNTVAKQLGESGASEGTLVVAGAQTAGRGRRGRTWLSPHGENIYLTILLRPKMDVDRVSGLTLIAALALAEGIKKVTNLSVQIKWPNDIICQEKKLCGILTEMSSEQGFIHYVAVGMGINVNIQDLPEEINKLATSVRLETGNHVSRCELIARVVDLFQEYYEEFQKKGSLEQYVEKYNNLLINKDKEVCIYHGLVEEADEDTIETGIARGIDHSGALLVEINGESKAIVSGEVSVRGKNGYV